MDTLTVYLRHSWLIRAFGHNPLVRTSDRVEAALLVLACVTVLVLTPVAGAISTAVHEDRSHHYSQEASARHAVVAVITGEPTSTILENRVRVTAPVQWWVGGRERSGVTEVDPQAEAGDQLQLWIDADGDQAGQPPSSWRAGTDAAVAGAGFWSAAVSLVAGMTLWLRGRLARRRDSRWEREWELWTSDGGGRTGSQA